MKRFYFLTMTFLLILASTSFAQVSSQKPFTWQTNNLTFVEGKPKRLVIKFKDKYKTRIKNGDLSSLTSESLSDIQGFAQQRQIQFRPLINVPEEKLQSLKDRAFKNTQKPQVDLGGYFIVDIPNADDAKLAKLADDLKQQSSVEDVFIENLLMEPPADINPPTPNFTASQTYINPNPGLDVAYARSLGIKGARIRFSDCEYGWNTRHEDLNDRTILQEPGTSISQFIIDQGYDEHGTAVAGILTAVDNNYGMTGIAPAVDFYTYPEYTDEEGSRRVQAITNAIINSDPGDIVLLEMQTLYYGDNYGPAELFPPVWDVVKQGSDAGVIVVAAAGNGSQDLDSLTYQEYQNRGDSGAIIVGAGSATTSHEPLYYSTYGSRVNVHSWGGQVASLGYGDLSSFGDKNQEYTGYFSGTSSASALVASSCALLQSYAIKSINRKLTPAEIRSILINTGIPQAAGVHIGPAINLNAAIIAIRSLDRKPILNLIRNKSVPVNENLNFMVTAIDPEASPLIFSASGLPSGATFNSATNTFNWTPGSAQTGNYSITFTVKDSENLSTSKTIQILVTAGETHWLEAEFPGTRTAPMAILKDASASYGKYVAAPLGSTGTSGKVRYTVTLHQAGTYILWGRQISPDANQNSFLVNIDQSGDKVWDTKISTSWVWDVVSNRGITGSTKFTLCAGTHTIEIKQLENGTRLDKIMLTRDLNLLPGNVYQQAENAPKDSTLPTTPTGLMTTTDPNSMYQVGLQWSPSTDNVGILNYLIYRNGILLGSTADSTPTYFDNTVQVGANYTYTVVASDLAQNLSAPSLPWQVTMPVVHKIITNITPVNYQKVDLALGIPYYTDRAYTITEIPAILSGGTLIKTADDDKANTSSAWLSFTTNIKVTVYVAYSSNATVLPAWMNGWTNTGTVLKTSMDQLKVYKKIFPAGSITLGGNLAAPANGALDNYVVIIKR